MLLNLNINKWIRNKLINFGMPYLNNQKSFGKVKVKVMELIIN
jgi:hypothetical protein